MESYQKRVVEEKVDLDGKIDRLTDFLDTDLFKSLDPAEQDRMRRQLGHMSAYSAVLGERIAAF